MPKLIFSKQKRNIKINQLALSIEEKKIKARKSEISFFLSENSVFCD